MSTLLQLKNQLDPQGSGKHGGGGGGGGGLDIWLALDASMIQ